MLSLSRFQNSLEQLLNQSQKQTYLIAVSGGVDSMVLLDLFLMSGYNFQVAHINYHLRREDSNLDQDLVSNYCDKFQIPFHLYEVSDKDNMPEQSIQNWARELRYNYFRKIQNEENLEYIVTAHHLNDQLETFIINLSKASGINGLSGIPANENKIIRPLLDCSKRAIYDFAKMKNIPFREDISNQKNDYLRNRIRNNVIPELEKINDNFLQNFSKSIRILNQSKNILNDLVREKIKQFQFSSESGDLVVDKQIFSRESTLIRFEILKMFGFTDEKEMQKMFTSQTGSSFLSFSHQLIVNRNDFIIRLIANDSDSVNEEIELEVDSKLIFVPAEIKKEILEFGNCYWRLNTKKIKLPLKLRKRKEGDFFVPSGMIGKKKLSKFYKDEKISILAKPKIWLLCDAKDNILGVLPFRQDGRFISNGSEFLEIII